MLAHCLHYSMAPAGSLNLGLDLEMWGFATDAARKKWEIPPPTSETQYWLPALGELLLSRLSRKCLRYLDFIFFILVRLSYYLSL